tara:strand:+ start:580 stop:1503 length:924 start_codon:yes stop_codon:yes gene_type:complete
MQDRQPNTNFKDFEDEINLQELFHVIFQGKWIIVSVTAFVSILGVIYSLSLPNIYTSKALLVPVNPSSNISGALGGYAGLAGMAGINLSSGPDEGNSAKALKKITSLSFFDTNIVKNIYLPDLKAVKSWSSNTNELNYDESIYKIDSNTWVEQMPSVQDSFETFKKHITLNEDKVTGFISLSVKHQSPYIAKQWVDLIINEVNAFYRQKDKSESEKAVNYLNQQISMTGLSEVKQVLAQLQKEEIKKLTLIEANKYYVFEYIDPAAVMEKKSEPRRSVICIIFALLGGMLSVLTVLMRHYVFNKEAS